MSANKSSPAVKNISIRGREGIVEGDLDLNTQRSQYIGVCTRAPDFLETPTCAVQEATSLQSGGVVFGVRGAA